MKYLLALLLLSGLFFAIPGPPPCYQETANESTGCGGLDTGSYGLGFWVDIDNPEYAYDGDWETYSSNFLNDTQRFLIITYIIPENTTAATWEVLYQLNTSVGYDMNFSLNTTYCNKSTSLYNLSIDVMPNQTAGYFSISCQQSAGNWAPLYSLGNPSNITGFSFTEEAMYWDISSYHQEGLFYEEGMYWEIPSVTPGTTMNPLILVILTAGAILLAIFPIAKIMDLI